MAIHELRKCAEIFVYTIVEPLSTFDIYIYIYIYIRIHIVQTSNQNQIITFLPLGREGYCNRNVCLSVVCRHSCEQDNSPNSFPILMKLHRIDP